MTDRNGLLPPSLCPERTFALVVGVEKYEISERWNLRGPARDAMRFAQWLTDRGVPPENVRLLLSPLEPERLDWSASCGLAALETQWRRASEEGVKDALLKELPQCDGDMLWIYWAGHGFIDGRHEMLLPCTDAHEGQLRHFNLDSALRWWRSDMVSRRCFQLQAALVDSCRVPARKQNFGTSDYGGGEPRAGRRQFRLYATRVGEAAKNNAEREAGQFTDTLLDELEQRPLLKSTEKLTDVGRAVCRRLKEQRSAGEGWQMPQIVKDRDWDECSFLDDDVHGEGAGGRELSRPVPEAAVRLDQRAWDDLAVLFGGRELPRCTYDAYAWAFKSANSAIPAAGGLPGDTLIDIARDLDDRLGGGQKKMPLPLPFVRFLADRAHPADKDWGEKLRHWVEETRARLGVCALVPPPSPAPGSSVLHLRLEPASEGEDRFLAKMWLRRQAATSIWESEGRPLDFKGVREALVQQLKEKSLPASHDAAEPHRGVERIEFHVPFDLLETPFDQWEVPPGRNGRKPRALGLLYQVVVRCPDERTDFDREAWHSKWRWLETHGGRHRQTVRVVEDAEVSDRLGMDLRADNSPACVVAHTSASRTSDVLDASLEGGIPVTVWRRGDPAESGDAPQEVAALLVPDGGPLDSMDVRNLPRTVHELRLGRAGASREADWPEDQLALLWDDPDNTMDTRSSLHSSPTDDGPRPS